MSWIPEANLTYHYRKNAAKRNVVDKISFNSDNRLEKTGFWLINFKAYPIDIKS